MRSFKAALLLTAALVAAALVPAQARAQFTGELIGFAAIDNTTSLPSGSRLVIQMVETVPNQAPRPYGAYQVEQIEGSGPYRFVFHYDAAGIKSANQYALQLKIGSGTQGQYQNLNVPIINGKLPPPPINLTRASFPLPEGNSGMVLLLLSALLAVAGAATLFWRRRRARSLYGHGVSQQA